jgi:hypothetical protein
MHSFSPCQPFQFHASPAEISKCSELKNVKQVSRNLYLKGHKEDKDSFAIISECLRTANQTLYKAVCNPTCGFMFAYFRPRPGKRHMTNSVHFSDESKLSVIVNHSCGCIFHSLPKVPLSVSLLMFSAFSQTGDCTKTVYLRLVRLQTCRPIWYNSWFGRL